MIENEMQKNWEVLQYNSSMKNTKIYIKCSRLLKNYSSFFVDKIPTVVVYL